MGKKHVLTVPGRYDQIKNIVQFVANGASQAGLDEDAVFHVELCCDEACTNIIEHAYGGEDEGNIVVSYETVTDTFQITIHDNGRTFNPASVPPPAFEMAPMPPDASPDDYIDQLKIGGLGIHFMRKLMDEVHFDFDPATGNTLVMIKKFPS
ncbi:MAG: ATP-binding protein [Chloroflexota bacterium]|nr:ATP-binding protein [Anaerolineales bacterium]MCA9976545.1 ATP-binding protein [Anaerolineales bacterium]